MKPMEKIRRLSGARRLSISTQDVFNLRNHNLSQLSRSTPGIYSPHRKGLDLSQQTINLISGTPPKSILIKPKEESIQNLEKIPDDEKEDKRSLYALRLELQFSAFVFLCFILVIVVPLSMVILGSTYIYSCPARSMIPIFLIVGGSAFLSFILLVRKLNKKSKESHQDEACYKKFFLAAALFLIGWFISGCYWIYGAYEPDYIDEASSSYCHKTLYLYSFWLLNSVFLTLSLFAVLFTVYILFGRENNHQDIGTKV